MSPRLPLLLLLAASLSLTACQKRNGYASPGCRRAQPDGRVALQTGAELVETVFWNIPAANTRFGDGRLARASRLGRIEREVLHPGPVRGTTLALIIYAAADSFPRRLEGADILGWSRYYAADGRLRHQLFLNRDGRPEPVPELDLETPVLTSNAAHDIMRIFFSGGRTPVNAIALSCPQLGLPNRSSGELDEALAQLSAR